MKSLLILAVFFFACCTVSDKIREPKEVAGELHGDCRPHAKVRRTRPGTLDVTFNQNLSEIVDGEVFCDFGYILMEVENPMIDGKPLTKLRSDDGVHYLMRDASVDITGALSYEFDGSSWISDADSMEKTADELTVRMRKFPPK